MPSMQRIAIGLVAALALSGCAGGRASVAASAAGTAAGGAPAADQPSELASALTEAGFLYSCGGHAFTPDVLSEPGRAEDGDSPESVTLREFVTSGMMETGTYPPRDPTAPAE